MDSSKQYPLSARALHSSSSSRNSRHNGGNGSDVNKDNGDDDNNNNDNGNDDGAATIKRKASLPTPRKTDEQHMVPNEDWFDRKVGVSHENDVDVDDDDSSEVIERRDLSQLQQRIREQEQKQKQRQKQEKSSSGSGGSANSTSTSTVTCDEPIINVGIHFSKYQSSISSSSSMSEPQSPIPIPLKSSSSSSTSSSSSSTSTQLQQKKKAKMFGHFLKKSVGGGCISSEDEQQLASEQVQRQSNPNLTLSIQNPRYPNGSPSSNLWYHHHNQNSSLSAYHHHQQQHNKSSPFGSASDAALTSNTLSPKTPDNGSVLSVSPSKRYISPSSSRSNSVVRIQAVNEFFQSGRGRKASNANALLPNNSSVSLAAQKIMGMEGANRTSSVPNESNDREHVKDAGRRRRPSSLKISSSRVVSDLFSSSASKPLAPWELEWKKEIESTCTTSTVLNDKLYEYCSKGDYDRVKFMLDMRVFTSPRRGIAPPRLLTLDILTRYGETKETLLHVAARINNDRLTDLLLNQGMSALSTDSQGGTPLHHACARGSADAAIILAAKAGADLSIVDSAGFTPLHLSIVNHHFDLAGDLMLFPVDINYKGPKGSTILHDVVTRGDMISLDFILNLPPQFRVLYNCRDSQGNTPLMKAVLCHELEIVRALLDKRIDIVVNSVNAKGQNIFHLLAQSRMRDEQSLHYLIRLLKQYRSTDKAKIQSWINEKDKVRSYTPFHLAVIHENEAYFNAVCNNHERYGIDLNATDEEGNNVAHLAMHRYAKSKSQVLMRMTRTVMTTPGFKISMKNKQGVNAKHLYRNM